MLWTSEEIELKNRQHEMFATTCTWSICDQRRVSGEVYGLLFRAFYDVEAVPVYSRREAL